jgi:hypothetical protein
MKIPNDTIGNRTRYLPAFSAESKTTAPPPTVEAISIFCTNLFNQLYQPSTVLQRNFNRCDNYSKAMFNTANCMFVSTAYSISGYRK